MKKTIFLAVLLFSTSLESQPAIEWTPLLQQSLVYFSSDRVTIGGLGIGAGVRFVHKKNLVAQTDASILWANGNAIATRLAIGYQRDGRWTPAIFGTFNLLWGQRTEVLSSMGQRPVAPVWAVGLRGAPLRFQNLRGYVSALEVGYGIGPDQGTSLELTILAAGIRW